MGSNGAHMNTRHSWTLWLAVLALAGAAGAQTTELEGVNAGGYNIHQSIEVGGRIADFSGNYQTYNTFVNLRSGPRLLEQSLEMYALPEGGTLFDRLSMSSFGYGGDPNNSTRLRISKSKWYDFRGQFRRDKNFWDYNLLANPANPTPPVVASFPQQTQIDFSPHGMVLSRRMTDLDLTLLPQRKVSLRLGVSQFRMDGPSLTTYHEGADVLLFQAFNTRSNRLRAGFDLNLLPKTRLSFDQAWDWYVYENPARDIFQTYQVNDATPTDGSPLVDLGIVLERISGTSGQPCAAPIANPAGTPQPTVNPTCNGYIEYFRTNSTHNRYPTSRLGLQSNYFKMVEFFGDFSYSGGSSRLIFDEHFLGRVSRTNQRQYDIEGPVRNKRKSVFGNAGMIVHFTDGLRMQYRMNFSDFRIPSSFSMGELSLFGASMAVAPNIYDPATCNPGSLAGCPVHNTSSPADIALEDYAQFLSQQSLTQLVELQWDFTRRVGARLGYRNRTRDIGIARQETADLLFYPGPTAALAQRGGCTLAETDPVTGVCHLTDTTILPSEEFTLNEDTLLFGFWARPVDSFRLGFDLDWGSSADTFTRLTPGRTHQYKLRANFKPKSWFYVNGTINIFDASNRNAADIDYQMNNNNFGFDVGFFRSDRFSLDVGYNYNDYSTSNDGVCFYDYDPLTSALTIPPGAVPVGPSGATVGGPDSLCEPARVIRAGVPQILMGDLFFDNTVHTGSFNLMFKPVKRVTTALGYTVTSSTGLQHDLNFNVSDEQNSLNYHLPSALIAVDVNDRWQLKSAWNHYGYNEKYLPGRTLPRDFRGNVFTLSARYAF